MSKTYDTLFFSRNCKTYLTFNEVERDKNMRNRIKEFREKKGFSQGKLAELCNISRQTINAIENNKYDPCLTLAFALAKELGVTVDELFLYEVEKKQ